MKTKKKVMIITDDQLLTLQENIIKLLE